MKRVSIALLVATAVTGTLVSLTRGQAVSVVRGAQATTQGVPFGPEITPLEAAVVALNALRAEESSRTASSALVSMTVGHSTLAEAKAVLENKLPSEAENGSTIGCLNARGEASTCPTPPEIVERRHSGTYTVVMTGRTFAPNVPVPRGRKGPSGNVRAVVINSVTGFIEEEYVGDWLPKVSALEGVTSYSSTTVEAAAQHVTGAAARLDSGVRGIVTSEHHAPISGALVRVTSRSGFPRISVGKTTTNRHGRFVVPVRPGEYKLTVTYRAANQHPCHVPPIRIGPGHYTSVTVTCPLR